MPAHGRPKVTHAAAGPCGLLPARCTLYLTWQVIERRRRNPTRARAYGEPHTCPERHLLGLPGVWGGGLCCPGATGKRPTHLHARCRGHVPGLQADLTRHVTAFKISKSGESCASENKATAGRDVCLGLHGGSHGSHRPPPACLGWGPAEVRAGLPRVLRSGSCSPPPPQEIRVPPMSALVRTGHMVSVL